MGQGSLIGLRVVGVDGQLVAAFDVGHVQNHRPLGAEGALAPGHLVAVVPVDVHRGASGQEEPFVLGSDFQIEAGLVLGRIDVLADPVDPVLGLIVIFPLLVHIAGPLLKLLVDGPKPSGDGEVLHRVHNGLGPEHVAELILFRVPEGARIGCLKLNLLHRGHLPSQSVGQLPGVPVQMDNSGAQLDVVEFCISLETLNGEGLGPFLMGLFIPDQEAAELHRACFDAPDSDAVLLHPTDVGRIGKVQVPDGGGHRRTIQPEGAGGLHVCPLNLGSEDLLIILVQLDGSQFDDGLHVALRTDEPCIQRQVHAQLEGIPCFLFFHFQVPRPLNAALEGAADAEAGSEGSSCSGEDHDDC